MRKGANVIGIDGCRKGWIAAMINENKELSFEVATSLSNFNFSSSSLILIDMPIGFPVERYRQCEVDAKQLLGPAKRSSIFYTPHKEAVYAKTHPKSSSINKRKIGKGVSIQTWCICQKIKEVNDFVSANKDLNISESHPELCFYASNNSLSLLTKKRHLNGIQERRKIISRYHNRYLKIIDEQIIATKRSDLKIDDILDATIMAIRASVGKLNRLPFNTNSNDASTILY